MFFLIKICEYKKKLCASFFVCFVVFLFSIVLINELFFVVVAVVCSKHRFLSFLFLLIYFF